MAYNHPPLVADATVNLIVGTATVNAVAAPGANKRIRVVGCHIGINRSGGAALIDAGIRSGTGLITVARGHGLSTGGTSIADLTIPEPGVPIAVNEALQLFATSTAATGAVVAIVYYYVDDIT